MAEHNGLDGDWRQALVCEHLQQAMSE